MSNMPERTYLKMHAWALQLGTLTDTAYIRADLTPAWHDKPTCEGLWVFDEDAYRIVAENGRLEVVSENCEVWVAVRGWYGPIPTPNDEEIRLS